MSNVSDRDAATTDPAKGPGGTGKGRAAREKLKTEAKAAFENAPADQGESEAKRKLRASLETIEARASEIRRWISEPTGIESHCMPCGVLIWFLLRQSFLVNWTSS